MRPRFCVLRPQSARRSAQPKRFIGELVIRVLPHWEMEEGIAPQYELREPFGFKSTFFGQVTVPEGFITDFGSVPAFAKPIVDNDDPDLLYGAIIHDWLYRSAGKADTRVLNRYQSDCVLREAMLAAGAPQFKAWLVFNAVRAGGGGAWK